MKLSKKFGLFFLSGMAALSVSSSVLAATTKVYPASMAIVTSGGSPTWNSYGTLENKTSKHMYVHLPIVNTNNGKGIKSSSVAVHRRYSSRSHSHFHCSLNSVRMDYYNGYVGQWGKRVSETVNGIRTVNTGSLRTDPRHHQYIYCRLPDGGPTGISSSKIFSYTVTEN